LDAAQKKSVREKWEIFKKDPFDPALGTHKINRLTALHKTTIYAAKIEANLRVVFKIVDNEVFTIDVGTQDIYK
jgi:Txe/YoeB family toxin of Txe-Axe toxin-antitoxin module